MLRGYRKEGICLRTHTAAELREVILGSLVLLVLVDPLVEVGLQELHLGSVLEQTRPVFLLELLLAQLHLDVTSGVMRLAVLGVDLAEEGEVEVICALQGFRVALESQGGGLEIELQVLFGYIGNGDGEVDEVLLGVGAGRALGP